MAIPDEDVAKVRQATDIAALIGEHTSLKRVGRRLVGLCPFHGERSPSFSVNAEEGLYYCFGCQASGDAISFVRAVEGCDFVEAVERLAARAGITVRNDANGADMEYRSRRSGLYEAFEIASTFYHDRLLSSPDARGARQYLRNRGYDGEIVRRYRLGFAPASYDALVRAKVLTAAQLREAGLAHESQRGNLIDTFRERVIFPIFDAGNRPVALGGRVLPAELRTMPGEPGPKYRNSQESPVYQKRATLYGLNWAKTEITNVGEAVVCEGYTDVIGFGTASINRAVATCGTALTEEHVRLLSRFAKRIVLCFDQDAAGQNAAARLYEWERRHELELAVAALPAGADPAELAHSDPEALRQAIAGARPFLRFRVERALDRVDLTTPEGRARGAEAAVRAIAEHPNALVRDQYLLELADRTHHEPARLRELLESAERELASAPGPTDEPPREAPEFDEDDGPPPMRGESAGPRRSSGELRAGRDALILCISRPDEAAAWFREELFTDPVQIAAFRALAAARDLPSAIDHAGSAPAALLSRLAVSDAEEIDLPGTLIELVRSAATRAIRDLEAEIRRLQSEGSGERLAQLSATHGWVRSELELLRDPVVMPGLPSAAMEAAGRLLAWLESAGQEAQ